MLLGSSGSGKRISAKGYLRTFMPRQLRRHNEDQKTNKVRKTKCRKVTHYCYYFRGRGAAAAEEAAVASAVVQGRNRGCIAALAPLVKVVLIIVIMLADAGNHPVCSCCTEFPGALPLLQPASLARSATLKPVQSARRPLKRTRSKDIQFQAPPIHGRLGRCIPRQCPETSNSKPKPSP